MKPDERAFEEHIARSLVERGGYRAVKVGNASGDFDAALGLDLAELFAFIQATQAREWDRLAKLHGGEARAREMFTDRLAKKLGEDGTVDVLRHGVVDQGVRLRLAYFRPAHGLTPELTARYDANRLTITRQLPYESDTNKTLDLALFVNSILIATAELKNALTGQGVEDAREQYRRDRDPRNVTLQRTVVHFAVDTEQVAMTTRLEGASTRFLPFNRGNGGGMGNPPNPEGHRTAYLWERVWEKDAWLDLLGRFVHVERKEEAVLRPIRQRHPRDHRPDRTREVPGSGLGELAGPPHTPRRLESDAAVARVGFAVVVLAVPDGERRQLASEGRAAPEPVVVPAEGAHGAVHRNVVAHVYGKAHYPSRDRRETTALGRLPSIFELRVASPGERVEERPAAALDREVAPAGELREHLVRLAHG